MTLRAPGLVLLCYSALLAIATGCSSTDCSTDADCGEGKVCKLGICATAIGGEADVMDDVQLDCRLAAPGDLILHEILADGSIDIDGDGEPDDLSGDGVTDGSDEEFIEIVNLADEPVGLLNVYFEISNTTAYPAPVCVPSKGAHVHFGSTQTLSLNNSGEVVKLFVDGELADLYDYPSVSEQSWTRLPQLSADGEWVAHQSLWALPASPGACSNGNMFPDCEGGRAPSPDTTGGDAVTVEPCPAPGPEPGALVITEVLADPGTNDANLSGGADDDDEFVEIVNVSGAEVALDHVSFSEAGGNVVGLPAGVCLAPNGVALVFSSVSDNTVYGDAVIVGLGSKLGLNNTSDTLTILDSSTGTDVIIDQITYGSEGGDNQSIVRVPELESDSSLVSFVRHDEAYGVDGATMSPGTCADGAAFPDCGTEPAPESCEGRTPEPGDLVINEFLSDPGGLDVNGDGAFSSTAEEFIEFVNRTADTLDVSTVTVRTGTKGAEAIQFTFPSGICIAPRQGIVIFGGGEPALDASTVYLATSKLSLNNDQDSIALVNADGVVLDQHEYLEELSGESWCRQVEGDVSTSFIKHSETGDAVSSRERDGQPVLFSPGTCVDGSPLSACL